MKKGLIIYQSNYGSAEQYARWISEDTGFPVMESKKVSPKDMEGLETVIIGCPIMAGKLTLASWVAKRWTILKDKQVLLYSTSGAAADDPVQSKHLDASFDADIRRVVHYFPQGGRMVFGELSPMHRFFMKLGQRVEKDPIVKAAMMRDKDHVDRRGLDPLLATLGLGS